MPTYNVFGLRLRTDLELPEAFPSSGDQADCELFTRSGAPPEMPQRQVGEEVVVNDIRVRSFEQDSGVRLDFDDTGVFDISADGRRIIWWSRGRGIDEAVQTDILGRVLALALHGHGVLTLHASAVSIDGNAIGFLAPKFFGKSTMAAALVRAGARLIGDDTLAIDVGNAPQVRPGVQSLRLWRETAAGIEVPLDDDSRAKSRYHPSAASSVGLEVTPLRALYVLRPARELPDGALVHREKCAVTQAVMTIVSYRKLGALLDGRIGVTSFERATELAQAVPTYFLHVVRDLSRVGEAAEVVMQWHRGALVSGASDPLAVPGPA